MPNKIKVKSTSSGIGDIAKQLRKRADLFRDPIGAKIVVPTGGTDPTTNALEWVLWQEFGTATKRASDAQFGISAGTKKEYPIPSDANADPPDYMAFPPYKGRTYGFRGIKNKLITPKGYVISHPGYPPKKFIRSVLREARDILRIGISQSIAKAFAQDKDFIAVENATVAELQKVKALIVASMRAAFGANTRKDGRLEGKHPATVFNAAAEVVGLNVEASANEVTGRVRIKSVRKPSKLVATKRFKFVSNANAKKVENTKPAPAKSKRLSKTQARLRNKR